MKSLPANPSESFKKRNPHLFGPEQCAKTAVSMLNEMSNAKPMLQQSSKPVMNKLEQSFQRQLVEWGWKHIRPQCIKFKLGNGVWYCPDFIATSGEGELFAFEVKGFMRDDAAIKLKVAASLYTDIIWNLVWRKSHTWNVQQILP